MAAPIDDEAERRFWWREGFDHIPTQAERQEWQASHDRLFESIRQFGNVLEHYARKRLRELGER